ncbi:DUF3592 domain-containing protein [Paracrocinitomix mangrovi]|uniref:DUF3592 domain-containing protein n=1 Tax=Paracrocinitomix mangrovi TaxID=2862509 RepID=UPI001C8EC42F|nr:DUF3592 domain-containing protein [Paracrocinitomix mangrovi]UKN00661.1 DUF3592 domain-containing protein [Paracrocinitomix mangrovi]
MNKIAYYLIPLSVFAIGFYFFAWPLINSAQLYTKGITIQSECIAVEYKLEDDMFPTDESSDPALNVHRESEQSYPTLQFNLDDAKYVVKMNEPAVKNSAQIAVGDKIEILVDPKNPENVIYKNLGQSIVMPAIIFSLFLLATFFISRYIYKM